MILDLTPLQLLIAEHPASDFAFAFLALVFAFAAFRARRRPLAASGYLSAVALALGLPMAADPFLHPWDERFHALVARNLLAHPATPTLVDLPLGFASFDWTETHVWLHKPPLSLWLMAFSRAVFGPGELALRLPSLILHACAGFACARLGPELFGDDDRGRAIGYWAAFLLAANGEMLSLASGRTPTDHPDATLIALTTIAGLAALRAANEARDSGRKSLLLALVAGVLCGAAVLTKSFPGFTALGVLAVALPWKARTGRSARLLLAAVLSCSAVALPWLIWARRTFPSEAAWEGRYALLHFSEALEGHAGSAFFHLARIPRLFGETCPVALCYFFYNRRALVGSRGLTLWFVAPYVIFSLAATKMDAYPLVAMPAVEVMIAAVLVTFWQSARAEATSARARLLMMIFCCTFVLLPVRFTVERWKPLARNSIERDRATGYKLLANALGPGPGLIVDVPDPISAMFYTNWTALGRPATAAELAEARARGWQIVYPALRSPGH